MKLSVYVIVLWNVKYHGGRAKFVFNFRFDVNELRTIGAVLSVFGADVDH
jgi:hypothetical protein